MNDKTYQELYAPKFKELDEHLEKAFEMNANEFLAYKGIFEITKTLGCTINLTPENHYTVHKSAWISKGALVRLSEPTHSRNAKLEPWGYSNSIFIEVSNPEIIGLEPLTVELKDFLSCAIVKRK